MTKPELPTYRTTNWRSYNAALKQRGSLLVWFDPETVWLAEPSGKRGRSATFTDAAIQACLTLKALFGLPLAMAIAASFGIGAIGARSAFTLSHWHALLTERLYRDAKLLEICGGTIESHQKNLTKDLTRAMGR